MRLSEKQRNEPPVKLTRAEKREIQAIIHKYKGDGKAHSAQASIPYQSMYPDGICKVTANTFSKCIEFADISYQLAQADTKTAIFENLCDLYNYLDASIHVQLSFVNRKTDPKQYAKSFEIKAQGDDFDDIRAEYSGILQDQLVRGNNGLTKRKFLTFTIEADNLKMARARLTRIETDLLGYFKTIGAVAHVLDAKERLEVLHGVLHPDAEPFQFEWKWLAPSGLSTKDFIAPSSFRFGNSRMFGLGGKYGAVSFLNILSPELSDEMLADFLNTENGIVVNLHVQAIDQSEAIKTVKRKITDLDAMKIQEQKRAVRSGYDMDILPSDLATYGQDAKDLLKTLQSRNERMFQITFLVMNTADTRQKLENDVFWAAGVAQKYNCSLVRLDYQQEQGLMSSLPLGANHIKIERSLTTSSVAVFVPFVTQELFMGGDAMYYGVNAKTGNMIMLDRKRARCPNGLKSLRDNPEMAQAVKKPVARFWQKQKIKRDYAKAARAAGQTAQGAASATKTTAAAAKKAAEKSKQAASFVARHWKGVLLIGGVGLMLMLIMGGLQSCTAMFGSAGTGVAATSYLSEDSDMLGAEAAYADMEADLQYELDNYESLHPGYDEYRFDLDEIGHDPYVLTSILSALHDGVYTLGDVQGDLAMLFEKQYTLTQTIETETRYRTETRTDSEGNPYTVQVPYTYYICNVKLENFDMSHLPVYIMGEEQMSLYAVYMHTLGNRPDLFPNGTYPNASTVKEPTYYDIPPEALEDATFAAMMAEAEKYVGYPYVWGGSSPSTSFDCSGFVSWVINHSGWDVGRLGAQGLCNICTPVSPEQAKPGDLVFFVGTYDTPGVSHVGIYVGNSVMLHCGDPISYTNLNSSYWQQHFYCYGRLP